MGRWAALIGIALAAGCSPPGEEAPDPVPETEAPDSGAAPDVVATRSADAARAEGQAADVQEETRSPDAARPDAAIDRPTADRPISPDSGMLPAGECRAPCTEAPALVLEKQRLRTIGGGFLGICGDANHTYGYHVAAARLPATDYSMRGEANRPVCAQHACAIDIGMNWPAARSWLRWLIREIREGRIQGVPEVIGSYDGRNVRYWSTNNGWPVEGVAYTGSGHDTWTHVSIHRSTALVDHRILAGWTATSGP